MGIDTSFNITEKLLACPFAEICHLPHHSFICRNPECKTCPDYIEKVKQLKSRTLF